MQFNAGKFEQIVHGNAKNASVETYNSSSGVYILAIFHRPGGWKNLQKFENCGNFWATKIYVTFHRKLNFRRIITF